MSSLLTPYLPEDFDSFWQSLLEEALAAPLDGVRRAQTIKQSDQHNIELIEIRSIDGEPLHGWFAAPDTKPAPAFLWLAPYGRWSMMPNEYGTREGFASLSFNFFGEPGFHEEAYTPARGYFSDGAEDPDTWICLLYTSDAADE